MKNKLKVGVFGVGSLGQHHARIYSELDSVDLVGVYDVNPERTAEIAERCGTQPFNNIKELAPLIDAASVAVPTDKHFELFTTLSLHNIHMLIEKPIAVSTAEAEAMVGKANEKNLILQVGHIERFNPVIGFLEDHLSKPSFIEAIRLAEYPPPRPDNLPRGTEVSVILDLMIHDLDIILHMVNSPVKEIRAVGVPVLSPSEVIANVRLEFENGCVANITASRISQERVRKIRVFQEDTYVSLDYMEQEGRLCTKSDSGINVSPVPMEKKEPLLAELDSFTQCVIHQNEPVVTGKHASDALKLAVDICKYIKK
jgi:predicted dehydrogenase